MKTALAAILLVASCCAASADWRPDASKLSCQDTASLIVKNGAVVVTTGPATFDRFVASRAFCTVSETLDPAFVRTRDNSQCFVGYRCREVPVENRR